MKTDLWYCAGWSSELRPGPIGRTLLGRDVVLFRDRSGAAQALGARCPHRGADLSRGTVVDGCVQCPFHGWRFDGGGRCVQVPSQPDTLKIPIQARVPSFPLRERDGVLWVWMDGAAPSADLPPAPVVPSDRSARRLFFAAHPIPAPLPDVLENFFDAAHVAFIHRSFGAHQNPLVARRRVTLDADGRGLRAQDDPAAPWRVGPRLPRGVMGALARVFLGLRNPVAQHTAFEVQAGAQIYLEYPNGSFDLFVTHLTPAQPTHTWMFVESLRTRATHALGDWLQRRAIDRVFAEGTGETALILDSGPDDPAPVSVESDRAGLAARRLYERWASGAPSTRPHDLAVGL